MSALFLHPAFWLFAGVVVVFANRRRMPGVPVGVIVALGALLALLRGVEGTLETSVAGFRLVWFHADRLSLLFALVFAIVALLGFLYGSHRMRAGETIAALLYAGSAIATVLAGDWITFFVFWEAMALSSLALIWQGGTAGARRAGMRYLLVHGAGGALLFVGIALHLAGGGETSLGALASDSPPFWLILGAVAINAAIPPLHAWLTDAYPEASTSGSVFLSAFTTKTAVYALLRLFPGTEILVPLGAAMALYGVVFAVIENDIRRLLGYHIVSQVGYMVAAVGIGTPLALNGAASHAFSHILYKALLFMGAGAAIEATGLRRLSDLGGVSRHMRFAVAMYAVGALSISGAPLFNGFISKSMIVSAAAEEHLLWTELLLVLAAVGTFLSVGLKLPWFAFFGERRGVAVRPLPTNLLAAMGIGGALCLLYGLFPHLLYSRLPYLATYAPYTLDHVVSAAQLLLATGLVFYLARRKLTPSPGLALDTDWLYRIPLARMVAATTRALAAVGPVVRTLRGETVARLDSAARRLAAPGAPPRRRESFAFRASIGWTVLFAAVAVVITWLVVWLRNPG
ncbi:MAG: Na(+)/H(+) antiporter subunit D [Acidobacteriota bacterium]|nr:Na(+)/H(+) antiporter subunit D [Acidobacteriota bacterium]